MTRQEPKRDMLATFEVDKAGLAKLLERRGKQWVVAELFQNAVDQNVTAVTIRLGAPDGGLSELSVEDDDPDGFADLRHAYTLFAESNKKGDAEKRGRFNLGEKLVIALCREARIVTTKGTVIFTDEGRQMLPAKRKRGSKFEGIVPMTDDEYKQTCAFVRTLLVPEGVAVTFNAIPLATRSPLRLVDAKLRTEKANDDGVLRPTTRKTKIGVYPVLDGEVAHLYEMGIPVVATGDKYHVDIAQKVPVNLDRDNVPPGYLRDVRTAVLNATYDLVTGDSAAEKWVDDALADGDVSAEAVKSIVAERFGDKVVIADPTDREAEKIAVSKGYTVLTGGALSKAAWANVKSNDIVKPAGQVTPSPNPNGSGDVPEMPLEHATSAIRRIVALTEALGARVLRDNAGSAGVQVHVKLVNDTKWPFLATYGPRSFGAAGEFTFNVGRLGFKWFDRGPEDEEVLALIVHEFAHHRAPQHLSREFYDECCLIGARLALVARMGPLDEMMDDQQAVIA